MKNFNKITMLVMLILSVFYRQSYASDNYPLPTTLSEFSNNQMLEDQFKAEIEYAELDFNESTDSISNVIVNYKNVRFGIDIQKTYFIPGAGFDAKEDCSVKNFANELIDTCSNSFGNDFVVVKNSSKKIPFKPLRAGINGRWAIMNGYKPIDYNSHSNIMRTVEEIENDFLSNQKNKSMNMIGSSYGSVVVAQTVIALLERDNNIDHIGVVVITASMIHPDSELANKLDSLKEQGKIQYIYYYPNANDNITACSGKTKKEAKQGFWKVVFQDSPSITNMKDHQHNIAALSIERAHHLFQVIIKNSPVTWLKNQDA